MRESNPRPSHSWRKGRRFGILLLPAGQFEQPADSTVSDTLPAGQDSQASSLVALRASSALNVPGMHAARGTIAVEWNDKGWQHLID